MERQDLWKDILESKNESWTSLNERSSIEHESWWY